MTTLGKDQKEVGADVTFIHRLETLQGGWEKTGRDVPRGLTLQKELNKLQSCEFSSFEKLDNN